MHSHSRWRRWRWRWRRHTPTSCPCCWRACNRCTRIHVSRSKTCVTRSRGRPARHSRRFSTRSAMVVLLVRCFSTLTSCRRCWRACARRSQHYTRNACRVQSSAGWLSQHPEPLSPGCRRCWPACIRSAGNYIDSSSEKEFHLLFKQVIKIDFYSQGGTHRGTDRV